MAAASGQVQCNASTATAVVTAANSNTIYIGKRSSRTVLITNPGATTVYLGGTSAVSSTTGYALAANASVTLTLYSGDAVYGIAASGTPTVHYFASGS